MQGSTGVNHGSKCLRPPNVANVALDLQQKKINWQETFAYFVIELIMPIGALVDAKNSNFEIFKSALYMKSGSMPLIFLPIQNLETLFFLNFDVLNINKRWKLNVIRRKNWINYSNVKF